MIFTTWNDYQLSRLMLGTVQLGMPYGIANCLGQPDYRDALAIVTAAVEGGVNCFDTAAAYGASEEVLGRALQELRVVDRVLIVTKVRGLTPDELADSAKAQRAIEQSVVESQQRLQIDCLPLVLFHREADAAYLSVLERLRDRGLLRHYGVSCENRPGPTVTFATTSSATALQLPGNVVDRRHQDSGVFREAAARGIAVFIRSVYLQGLLVMPEDQIPVTLREIVPIRRTLATIAAAGSMTLAELALRYMLTQDGVTSVLTGVETVNQVRDNLAMFDRGPLAADIIAAIDAVQPDLSEALVTPWMWPSLAASVAATPAT